MLTDFTAFRHKDNNNFKSGTTIVRVIFFAFMRENVTMFNKSQVVTFLHPGNRCGDPALKRGEQLHLLHLYEPMEMEGGSLPTHPGGFGASLDPRPGDYGNLAIQLGHGKQFLSRSFG